jgi:hypothetical protein
LGPYWLRISVATGVAVIGVSPYRCGAGVGRLTDPKIGTALLVREVVFGQGAG